MAGINDLQTTSPLLAAFWNYDKNGTMLPTNITDKSDKLAHWICADGHEWSKPISRMFDVQRICPVCHNRKSLIGHNDLATTNPEIARQWDAEKNAILLSEVTSSTDASAWWLCNKDHSWNASIASRTRGNGCPVCSGRQVLKGYNDLATIKPQVAEEWHPTLNGELTAEMVTRASNKRVWWKCIKGHEWQAKLVGRTYAKSGCPDCATAQTVSRGEQEVADFVESLGFKIIQSDRKLLDGLELDIYVPEKKIAIEYNGLYWHSDLFRDKNYHYDKWLRAKEKGIQLIQIWEDEWNNSPKIVKNMLSHKLDSSGAKTLYARKLIIVRVYVDIAEKFFNENHIQGYASASYYYALKEKETESVVSILALKKEQINDLNIIRYATSCNVVGGFTKLLKHAERELLPDKFITFSDNCVSDGALYQKSNFVADRELSPDYRYMVNGERKHKFGYRLKRFKNDENLQWVEGYSERQLAQLNNIPRIWDAGKIRWVKKIN